jgi:hypothetical protein
MCGRVEKKLTAFFVFALNASAALISMAFMQSTVLSHGHLRYNGIVW